MHVVKKVHRKGALIGVLFGIVSVVLLLSLGAHGAFPMILLWMMVPVFMKKISVKLKGKEGK